MPNIYVPGNVVSQKKTLMFFIIQDYLNWVTPGRGKFQPKEHDWYNFCRGHKVMFHATYLNYRHFKDIFTL
jgi:hypothetical protein